ncbi:MAG TPA: Holliday junction branch migration protein RuvA [Chloroflexota bacterium]|nr:Holliday junction branch migration protein RuvA [Chloroflexota bacterium]
MISYIQGTLKRKYDDHVVVDVGGVGYEVFLPQFVRRTYDSRAEGDAVELEIYYHASERQIRPILFGFNHRHEKQFFEKIITVEDVGPVKAARALGLSVSTVARAIESEDVTVLRRLPGIGDRTAKKMIATLRGRVVEEALLQDEGYDRIVAEPVRDATSDLTADTLEILLSLGHRRSDAMSKIEAALDQNPEIETPEELIREVYRREARA